MMILGVNSYFEHPSVVLLRGSEVLFAAEDERFTRIKHGRRYSPFQSYFPMEALDAALRTTGVQAREIREIAFSYSGRHHLLGLVGCLLGRRVSSLRDEISAYFMLRNIRATLRTEYAYSQRHRARLSPEVLKDIPFREWPHHDCHASSAYHCSGFDEALVVVADGAGELDACTVYHGRDGRLGRIAAVPIPHSLGIFYSMLTAHIGFEPFSDEFKVMAMAALGKDRYGRQMRDILKLRPGGSYAVDMNRLRGLGDLLGPTRKPSEPLGERHYDIARSAQARLEEALLHVIGHHLERTGCRDLCLAGGVFMNCVFNGALAAKGLARRLYVQPVAHDAGTALGAAILSARRLGGDVRPKLPSLALGTAYTDEEVRRLLDKAGVAGERVPEEQLPGRVASLLARGKVGGIFRGRMEFGSRALGQRSLIASPCFPEMRDRLNLIKSREGFRPVAPVVTEEAFSKYFIGEPNPFMSFAAQARESRRGNIPACVHDDGSARPQTVGAETQPFLHALLRAVGEATGHEVLVNTSLNILGRPIVEAPLDALACFSMSPMDFLLLENHLIVKGGSVWT